MRHWLLIAVVSCGVGGCEPDSSSPEERAEVLDVGDDAAMPYLPPERVSERSVAPFPNAAEVRLFIRDEHSADGGSEYLDPDGLALSRAQRDAFESALSAVSYRAGRGESGSEADAAACFVPHHFFRYYDGEGEQIGEVAVCFCCFEVRITPEPDVQPASGADFVALAFDEPALRGLVTSIDLPVDINCD